MISKTVEFILDADEQYLKTLLATPTNLPKFWKYLKGIEVINEREYIARFKVFMNFKFKMRVLISANSIIHEGVMDRPKAFFRFTINFLKQRKGVKLAVTGEYKGPFEFLAGSPMQSFLEYFMNSLREYLEKGGETRKTLTPQELFSYLSKESEGKRIIAKVKVDDKTYEVIFENGKISSVNNYQVQDFITDVLKSKQVALLAKEEEYEQEFNDISSLLNNLEKNCVADIELKDIGARCKLVVKDGKIVNIEGVDLTTLLTYRGKVVLLYVNENSLLNG
jgi:hypothetical protein